MPRLLENINFPKLVTALAATFGIALGACGLTAFASKWASPYVIPLGMVELVVMVFSAVGLVISVIGWILAEALGNRAAGGSDPIKLFDDSDKTKP